jgi:hypothetical protein
MTIEWNTTVAASRGASATRASTHSAAPARSTGAVELLRRGQRRSQPLVACGLVGPDIGGERQPVLGAARIERVPVAAGSRLDLERRVERRPARHAGADDHGRVRRAPARAVQFVAITVEAQVEARAGSHLEEAQWEAGAPRDLEKAAQEGGAARGLVRLYRVLHEHPQLVAPLA